MLIATFNCNSIRARLPIVLDWLEKYSPDVLALQETKCTDEMFPVGDFEDAGWHVAFRGQKGYNGVAMVTKDAPDEVSFGLGDDEGQSAPRLACIKYADAQVLNTYVPQGYELGTEKFVFKLEWFVRLRDYLAERFDAKKTPLVWVGDLNVAPEPKDVYDHDRIWPHVCHCKEVIDAFNAVVRWGFVDVFRKHVPDEGVFTFWDYRMPRALDANRGWRLDHVLATRPLADKSTEAFVDVEPRRRRDPKPSDHTFVAARFEI